MGDDRDIDVDFESIRDCVEEDYGGVGPEVARRHVRELLAHSEALALRLRDLERDRDAYVLGENTAIAERNEAIAKNDKLVPYVVELEQARNEARLRLEEVTRALGDVATSLRTISKWDRRNEGVADAFWSIRGYAGSRANVAEAALPASPVPLGLLKPEEIQVPNPASSPEAAARPAETSEPPAHVVADVGDCVSWCRGCQWRVDQGLPLDWVPPAPTTSQTVTDGARKT